MLSIPVAVADRMSAELSAAQQACVVADTAVRQGGCVRLPSAVLMLAMSSMALSTRTHRPVAWLGTLVITTTML